MRFSKDGEEVQRSAETSKNTLPDMTICIVYRNGDGYGKHTRVLPASLLKALYGQTNNSLSPYCKGKQNKTLIKTQAEENGEVLLVQTHRWYFLYMSTCTGTCLFVHARTLQTHFIPHSFAQQSSSCRRYRTASSQLLLALTLPPRSQLLINKKLFQSLRIKRRVPRTSEEADWPPKRAVRGGLTEKLWNPCAVPVD